MSPSISLLPIITLGYHWLTPSSATPSIFPDDCHFHTELTSSLLILIILLSLLIDVIIIAVAEAAIISPLRDHLLQLVNTIMPRHFPSLTPSMPLSLMLMFACQVLFSDLRRF